MALVLDELHNTNPYGIVILYAINHHTGIGQIIYSAGKLGDVDGIIDQITAVLEPHFTSVEMMPTGLPMQAAFSPAGREACARSMGACNTVDYMRLATGENESGLIVVAYPAEHEQRHRAATLPVLTILAPVVERTMYLHVEHSEQLRKQMNYLLEAFSEPAMLCDAEYAVIGANMLARRYFEQSLGHAADLSDRRFLAKLDGGIIHELIKRTELSGDESTMGAFTDSRGNFVLAEIIRHIPQSFSDVVPAPFRLPFPAFVVKLKIARRVVDVIPFDTIKALGITPAEFRLLEGLLNGRTVQEIAQDNNVKYNTARNQLASLASKTGLRTQADIIRFFTSLS
ncbi:hypothetical protein DLJ53_24545 [Acuticoccus sediminis]|uniref:HTH luxR-type domain-containing protein n=2 Tax=Acuticoccus sediminis TaxID=2184697 RepID=A0A8B2NPE5_9HYPH|nr:hypothetical protein DLJ53_24545 [Acuticoccus sediminis]